MPVRLILMRVAASIALVLLGGCASVEEQPRFPDVHARLVLLDTDTVIGGPLRVRLDLVNDSDTPMLYDAQQSESNGSFEILGPNQKAVPFTDGPRQTFGTYSDLPPRSTITVIRE